MLRLDLTVSLFLQLGPLQRRELVFGQHDPFL
jgi:hypothetical protein